MTIAPGTRLGPYEITAPLGAGGMGEVWRARDTRLGRDVAIKVLPAAFAADEALRARFEREAKTISSLNHPNICTLYDVGREGETDYLVLEMVEGETLAARLARGPLPTGEVLRYGMQIADALEKAHRAGIVHRDLKPGNIMLTKSGAKLLDFGLARSASLGPAAGDRAISPTMTMPLTKEGHLVGTFQYMAPEQLEGAEADARSDLWALGCVFYEMATAKRAFDGASQASLISAIMKDEPRPIGELAAMSPPALDRAVQQCLAKDPDDRWQSAGDLRRELAWILASGSQASAIAPGVAGAGGILRARGPRALLRGGWTRAIPLVVGMALAGLLGLMLGRGRPESPVRLTVLHDGAGSINPDPVDVALSPDGENLAYVVFDSTGTTLWVRPLAAARARVLVQSASVIRTPFWSPDSRTIAYFTTGEEGRLWKASLAGGSPAAIAPATDGRGGTWNADGVILFAPAPSGPLFRVRASGGEVTQATILDSTRSQSAHRVPQFLPDGDHFLYSALPRRKQGIEVFVGSLRSGKSERLVTLPVTGASYAAPGFLLFARDGKLMAQPFDAGSRKLTGEPFEIADEPALTNTTGGTIVSASRNGRLAWLPYNLVDSRLEWVDRAGRRLETLEAPDGQYADVVIGPDGHRVLAERQRSTGVSEVMYFDPDRGGALRVSPAGIDSYSPLWAPDGESFYMCSNLTGRDEFYQQSLARSGGPRLIPTSDHQFKRLRGVLPGGRTLLYIALAEQTGWDLFAAEPGSGRPPRALLDDPSYTDATVSPDGRTLAVESSTSESVEIYLAPFDRPLSQKRIVSASIGNTAWGPGGRELLYDRRGPDGVTVFALPVDPAGGVATGPAHPLFTRPGMATWDAAPDGQRFLLSVAAREERPNSIRVDLDWTRLPRAK